MRHHDRNDHKITVLGHLPPFRAARRRRLRWLAAITEVVTATAGTVLHRADGRAPAAYLVVHGIVQVVDASGVATCRGRGDLVDDLGAATGGRHPVDAVAATDVTLLEIRSVDLRALFGECPSLLATVGGPTPPAGRAAPRGNSPAVVAGQGPNGSGFASTSATSASASGRSSVPAATASSADAVNAATYPSTDW